MRHYRDWLYAAVLTGVLFFIYQPAWNGQPLLDDTDYLLSKSQSSLRGLLNLWITPPPHQYHPLVDTVFWLGSNLWGGSMLGYHLTTIGLHAIAALLLFCILQRLKIRGAWLAAAIFAVHPVQVESVAWAVELKNTLSGVFFFICVLAYLQYEESSNKTGYYILLLASFLFGMMAKPIVATVPVVILIIQWWQKGRIDWRKYLRFWLPLIIIGTIAGLLTIWIEREISGSEREIILLSPAQRFLVAGRAVCFYLGKIVWPANLSFMYPRWKPNPLEWWQYLFPIAAILILILAWENRSTSRAPFAGLLFFLLTIFPLIGFFNVSFFRFAFVADHFQYLSLIGIITPIAAGYALFLCRLSKGARTAGYIGAWGVLLTLSTLSWTHAHVFVDQVTCYRAVAKNDPTSWAAHLNLGFDALARHSSSEASEHFQTILETNADNPPAAKRAHLALGAMLVGSGHTDEAMEHLEKAVQIDPNYAEAHANIAAIFLDNGRMHDGIAELRRAVQLAPRSPEMKLALAWELATCSDPSLRNGKEAVEFVQRAESSLGKNDPKVLRVLAAAKAELGEFGLASQLAREGLEQALKAGDRALAEKIGNEIQLYDSGRPIHNHAN